MNNWFDFGVIDGAILMAYILIVFIFASNYNAKYGSRYSILFSAMSLIHLLTTAYYLVYIFLLDNRGDTKYYYILSLSYDFSIKQGSEFVVYIASIFTQLLKAKLIGSMLIFSFIGLLGWKLLLDVIGKLVKGSWSNWLLIFLLPQMHFWTCALGKDSLSFFAMSYILYLWYNKKMILYYLIPGGILLLVRSHIFLLVISSFLTSVVFQARTKLSSRIILSLIGIVIISFSIPLVQERLSLDDLNKDSLVSYSEELLTRNQKGGSSVDMAESNILIKLMSYISRPIFYDATNLLQLEASLENVFWLLMLFSIIFYYRFRYISIFPFLAFIFLWFIQSAVLTNLAIAMRQKMMFFPFMYFQLMVFIYVNKIWPYRYMIQLRRNYSLLK